MKYILLSALLVLVPAASIAADEGATSAPTEKAKKPRKICREQPRTGSMFKETTCKTQAEWDALEAQARDTVDNWSRTSGGRYSGGADGGGGVRSGVGIGGQ